MANRSTALRNRIYRPEGLRAPGPARTLVLLLVLTALPTVSAALPPFPDVSSVTVAIVGFETLRTGEDVDVTVLLRGVATTLGIGALDPVEGEVTILSPTPCWPDYPRGCADVLVGMTVGFEAFPLGMSSWEARVGPFSYPSAPVGRACVALVTDAAARHGAASASDHDERSVCG